MLVRIDVATFDGVLKALHQETLRYRSAGGGLRVGSK